MPLDFMSVTKAPFFLKEYHIFKSKEKTHCPSTPEGGLVAINLDFLMSGGDDGVDATDSDSLLKVFCTRAS